MKRRLAVVLAVTLGVSMLAAGCGSSEEPKESKETKESKESNEANTGSTEGKSDNFISDKEFTLSVVCGDEEADGIETAIKIYSEMYPNAKVEVTQSTWGDGGQDMREKELLMINSGQTPDVMKMVWSKEFAREGLLADITEEVEALPIYDKLTSGQKERMTYDGKIYGVTYGSNSIFMYYNKDILEQAGWENPPQTMEEVKQLGADIQAKGVKTESGQNVYLTEFDGGNWDTDYWVWSQGGELMNEDYTDCLIDSPESIAAYQTMQDMVKDGMAPKPDGNGTQLWLNNQVALYFGGDWDYTATRDAGVNAGMTTTPVGPNGENAVSIGGVEWGVSVESEIKQEAVDFISIFADDEFTRVRGRGVTDISMYDDPEIQAAFEKEGILECKMSQRDQLAAAETRYNFLEVPFIYPEGKKDYANALQRILINMEDVETVMTEAAEAIERGIADNQ